MSVDVPRRRVGLFLSGFVITLVAAVMLFLPFLATLVYLWISKAAASA